MIMSTHLKNILEIIRKELGARPSDVPGKYRKITVKGMPFRVSRFVSPRCCNVAVMEMNTLIMNSSTIIITPFEKKAPLVNIDVFRILGKTKYICEVYEFDGSNHASFYEDIPCIGLNSEPLSDDFWFSDLRTFVKCFSKGPFQGGKDRYEQFLTEFTDRTCRIYKEAGSLGIPGDEARDFQIRRIKDYAHGLIEKGGVSTEVFKSAMSVEQLKDFYDTVLFRTRE